MTAGEGLLKLSSLKVLHLSLSIQLVGHHNTNKPQCVNSTTLGIGIGWYVLISVLDICKKKSQYWTSRVILKPRYLNGFACCMWSKLVSLKRGIPWQSQSVDNRSLLQEWITILLIKGSDVWNKIDCHSATIHWSNTALWTRVGHSCRKLWRSKCNWVNVME